MVNVDIIMMKVERTGKFIKEDKYGKCRHYYDENRTNWKI